MLSEIKKARLKCLMVVLILIVCALLFCHYGRGIWHPLYVKIAGRKTVDQVISNLKVKGVSVKLIDNKLPERLLVLCLKEERIVEVWGFMGDSRSKLAEYPLTGFSGKIGPKLIAGDCQIPEGVYRTTSLNPNSSYHLSIKINYPNNSDKYRGTNDARSKLGGDIFIHGKTNTIGCIPIGDAAIEELFLLVHEVGLDNVAVIISPYDMRVKMKDIQIPGIVWEGRLYGEIKWAIQNELDLAE